MAICGRPKSPQAIRTCSHLAVVCSATSVTSRNVRQELQLAWDYDRPILPLMLEPVQFPPEIAYFLHGRQWIDLLERPEDQWLAQIAVALQSHDITRTASGVESTLATANCCAGVQLATVATDGGRAGG